MNRKQRRAYQRVSVPRIGQLLKSTIINDKRLNGLPKEELQLLKEGNHSDNELQLFYTKQERLVKREGLDRLKEYRRVQKYFDKKLDIS